jgi:hypothetical protein
MIYLYMFKRFHEYDQRANAMEVTKAAVRRRFFTFIQWL